MSCCGGDYDQRHLDSLAMRTSVEIDTKYIYPIILQGSDRILPGISLTLRILYDGITATVPRIYAGFTQDLRRIYAGFTQLPWTFAVYTK